MSYICFPMTSQRKVQKPHHYCRLAATIKHYAAGGGLILMQASFLSERLFTKVFSILEACSQLSSNNNCLLRQVSTSLPQNLLSETDCTIHHINFVIPNNPNQKESRTVLTRSLQSCNFTKQALSKFQLINRKQEECCCRMIFTRATDQ